MINKLFFLCLIFCAQAFCVGGIKGKITIDKEVLNDVVVYLEPHKKIEFLPPQSAEIMDQVNLKFSPHVLPVLLGTKVIFPNSDKIRHSVFSIGNINKFDFGTYPPGTDKTITCNEAGVIPILCYIHHDMSAYIVVLKTPYFGLTNSEGEYLISNVPEGSYTLSFWHEDVQIKSIELVIPKNEVMIKNIIVND